MKRIILSGTGFEISRLSFGTASLHHLLANRQRQAILETAADHGFSHFDTSPYYGFGIAEQELGRFLKRRRDKFTIASKIGLYPPDSKSQSINSVWLRKGLGKVIPSFSKPIVDWTIQSAIKSLDKTLNCLKTEYLDILFLHEPDPGLINAEELFGWLQDEKTQGRIRAWGLAGSAKSFEEWLRINHPLSMVLQVKDSLEHREGDIVLKNGRDFQITYGYLSFGGNSNNLTVSDLLSKALERNHTGSVLVSARSSKHIAELAAICDCIKE